MKKHLNWSFLFYMFLFTSTSTFSQTFNVDIVKLEIKEAALSEQIAFQGGNCEQVLNFMAEDITFLANGRMVPSKKVVEKFCKSIPRPFKTAMRDTLEIYPLSETTGYAIRTLEYAKNEKIKIFEFVTKIWKKTDGEWRITHLHSTINEIPISD